MNAYGNQGRILLNPQLLTLQALLYLHVYGQAKDEMT